MEAGLSGPGWDRLIEAIAPHSRLVRAWPLAGGTSAEMTAFEIEAAEGITNRMILRRPSARTLQRNPRAARDEFKVLQTTHTAGLATPRPYYLDETGTLGFGPCLVIGYIDAEPEFAPAGGADFIRQFARQLAEIHRIDGSRSDLAFLPPPALASAADPGQRATTPDGSLDQGGIREALEAAGPPRRQKNAPVLLHGDYWPGNVLWRGGQLAAVIDWEDAARGEPLADLAIARLDIVCLFGAKGMQAFTKEYQAGLAVDDSDLPFWDLRAALRLARFVGANLAEWAAFFGPFGRPDITEQTLREQFRYFVEQAIETQSGRV